jgi:CheY-like chemotaxis protein
MVVCEQPALRDSISQLIEDHGLESFPAADGIDALRQIYHVRPQVIVSDAELARLSGFNFLPFVRKRFPTAGVIALGGNDHEGAPVADMTLPKEPWSPETLIRHLHHLLSQWPLRSEFQESDCA